MNEVIEEKLKGRDVRPVLDIDKEINFSDIDFELAQALKKFEPFGEDNEEPVFLTRGLVVEKIKTVGNGSQHLKVFLRGSDGTPKIFEAIGFGLANQFSELKTGNRIDAVYNLRLDEWNGNKKIQLRLIDVKIN